MDTIRILVVDDEQAQCEQITELLNDSTIDQCAIKAEFETDFETGKEKLATGNYDIVILDVFRGTPSVTNTDVHGEDVLDAIKQTVPVAVIFYTGLTTNVDHLKSDIVRVVSKTSGNLEGEIESLLKTGLPQMRQRLHLHISETMRDYYWEFINKNSQFILDPNNKALSEYLVLRRLAVSINKKSVNKIFGTAIAIDKVHPLEFYVCPPFVTEFFETGDILQKLEDSSFWVILTPSCDFAQKKAEFILLVKGKLLTEQKAFTRYKTNQNNDNRDALKKVIESRVGERYFFLPRNDFIKMPDLVLDFQEVANYKLAEFTGFNKVARIDDPFVQDMLATFVRSRNRPGSPDLDSEHVINYLNDSISSNESSGI